MKVGLVLIVIIFLSGCVRPETKAAMEGPLNEFNVVMCKDRCYLDPYALSRKGYDSFCDARQNLKLQLMEEK
jgi:hypothetical protein